MTLREQFEFCPTGQFLKAIGFGVLAAGAVLLVVIGLAS